MTEGFVEANAQNEGGDEKVTFRTIVLSHIRRIAELGSKEWYGGFKTQKTIILSNGIPITSEEYVQDSRKAYCNAIIVLYYLLEAHFMKDLKEKESKEIMSLRAGIKDKKDQEENVQAHHELFSKLNAFLKTKDYLGTSAVDDN